MIGPADRTLANLCSRVYDDDPRIVHAGGCEALMLREGRTLRVVLRGTKGRKDLMSDLRAWPEFVPGLGKVHPGFHAGAVAMVPEIRRRSQPGDYLILGGHSKGGADAAQISGILINLGVVPDELVTFGEPRSGFAPFARVLAVIPRQVRYVNGSDAVTSHPFPVWGWRHRCPAKRIGSWWRRYGSHPIDAYLDA